MMLDSKLVCSAKESVHSTSRRNRKKEDRMEEEKMKAVWAPVIEQLEVVFEEGSTASLVSKSKFDFKTRSHKLNVSSGPLHCHP
jgi:hypothetical protein